MKYINELPIVMIRCLLITLIIELIVAIIIGVRKKKDIFNIILVNIITNPLVVSINLYFSFLYLQKGKIISLIILEILAFLIEGIIYNKYINFNKINPFLLSLVLNVSSFVIGKFIQILLA